MMNEEQEIEYSPDQLEAILSHFTSPAEVERTIKRLVFSSKEDGKSFYQEHLAKYLRSQLSQPTPISKGLRKAREWIDAQQHRGASTNGVIIILHCNCCSTFELIARLSVRNGVSRFRLDNGTNFSHDKILRTYANYLSLLERKYPINWHDIFDRVFSRNSFSDLNLTKENLMARFEPELGQINFDFQSFFKNSQNLVDLIGGVQSRITEMQEGASTEDQFSTSNFPSTPLSTTTRDDDQTYYDDFTSRYVGELLLPAVPDPHPRYDSLLPRHPPSNRQVFIQDLLSVYRQPNAPFLIESDVVSLLFSGDLLVSLPGIVSETPLHSTSTPIQVGPIYIYTSKITAENDGLFEYSKENLNLVTIGMSSFYYHLEVTECHDSIGKTFFRYVHFLSRSNRVFSLVIVQYMTHKFIFTRKRHRECRIDKSNEDTDANGMKSSSTVQTTSQQTQLSSTSTSYNSGKTEDSMSMQLCNLPKIKVNSGDDADQKISPNEKLLCNSNTRMSEESMNSRVDTVHRSNEHISTLVSVVHEERSKARVGDKETPKQLRPVRMEGSNIMRDEKDNQISQINATTEDLQLNMKDLTKQVQTIADSTGKIYTEMSNIRKDMKEEHNSIEISMNQLNGAVTSLATSLKLFYELLKAQSTVPLPSVPMKTSTSECYLAYGWLRYHRKALFNRNSWSKKFVCLRSSELLIFDDATTRKLLTSIDIATCKSVGNATRLKTRHHYVFQIQINDRDFLYFSAETDKERSEWISSISHFLSPSKAATDIDDKESDEFGVLLQTLSSVHHTDEVIDEDSGDERSPEINDINEIDEGLSKMEITTSVVNTFNEVQSPSDLNCENSDEDESDADDLPRVQCSPGPWLPSLLRMGKDIPFLVDTFIPSSDRLFRTVSPSVILILRPLPNSTIPISPSLRTHCFLTHNWGMDSLARIERANEVLQNGGFISCYEEERGEASI